MWVNRTDGTKEGRTRIIASPLWLGPGSRAFSIAAAVALAAGLLLYSIQGVEWRQVGRGIAGVNVRYLTLWAAIGTLALGLRALRWRVILSAGGTVCIPTVFWATATGYLANNVLPARAGEVARIVMICSRSGLAIPFVLATALAERIVDALVLVAVASAIVLTVPVPLGWLVAVLKPLAVLGLAAALLMAFLPRLEPAATSVLARTTLPDAWKRRIQNTMRHFVRGVGVFRDYSRVLRFAGLTVVIWSLDAVATVIGGVALGFVIPLPAALLLLAALGLSSALPSTPGYVGLYQLAAVSVLTPFGLSRTDAITYILVAQMLMLVVTGIFGSVGLVQYLRSRTSSTLDHTNLR